MPEILLVVEDGTGKPDANTYADLDTVRNYAFMRGVKLPDDDEKVKTFIIQAVDYVESFSARFRGQRTTRAQALQFPRTGVYIDGDLVPYNVIPKQLVSAVCQLACDVSETGPIQGASTKFAVKRTKTDVLETEYAVGSNAQSAPAQTYSKAMAFLGPLLGYVAGNMVIR